MSRTSKVLISIVVLLLVGLGFLLGYTKFLVDYQINTLESCVEKEFTTIESSQNIICITPTGKYFKEDLPNQEDTKVKIYLFNINKFNEPDNSDYVSGVYRESNRTDLEVFALEEIIKGPNLDEIDLGLQPTFGEENSVWFVSDSNCEGDDFTLAVVNSKATVQFCRETMTMGDMSGNIVEQQIGSTLKEFDDIDLVRILNYKGECFNDMRGGTDIEECYF